MRALKALVVIAFFAILGGAGITAIVQHSQSSSATVSVSPEVQCRTVTRRAFDSLAKGRITQSKAQAMVDGACDALPAGTRNAIIDREKAAAVARYTPSPSSS
jgi:hypothetical protein